MFDAGDPHPQTSRGHYRNRKRGRIRLQSHAVQDPGFYYYVTARCTEMQRSSFYGSTQWVCGRSSLLLSVNVDASIAEPETETDCTLACIYEREEGRTFVHHQ